MRRSNVVIEMGSIAILVNDARKSAEWYRDKLGFEIVGLEGHAVFLRPKGSRRVLVHLCERCADWGNDRPGGRTGVWLRCGELTFRKDENTGRMVPASNPDEVEKVYLELEAKGVVFSVDLTQTSWGKYAIFKDPDGNEFELS